MGAYVARIGKEDSPFGIVDKKRSGGSFVVLVTVALVVCLALVGFAAPQGRSSTSLTASFDFENASLTVVYRSEAGELEATYAREGLRKKIRLSSEERLGVLIVVSGEGITHTARFLEDGEVWRPEITASRRMKLSQRPGWSIFLVEDNGSSVNNKGVVDEQGK